MQKVLDGPKLHMCTQKNVDCVCDLIKQDRLLTTRRLTETTRFSNGTIGKTINNNLRLHKVSVRWIQQKRVRIPTSDAKLKLFHSNSKKNLDHWVIVDKTSA